MEFRAPKLVINLTTTGSDSAAKTRMLGPVWDTVKSHWESQLVNMGEFLLSAQHTSRDSKVINRGSSVWEFYPKVIIIGTTAQTENQILSALEDTWPALKTLMLSDLQGNPLNATGTFTFKRNGQNLPELVEAF